MVVASKFHRNAIITGSIDSFCLACESYLKCEDDAITHIDKPVHKKNLDAVAYLEKYEDDHIRKIKKGYYCEFCNLLLATTTRVKIHVTEQGHKENRGVQLLKRVGNSVIAFKSLLIKESSWHGLIENTCAICNIEFENEDIHKNEREHILNLVQNKLQFDDNNNIFRKIDDGSFHCVTCNTVFAADGISTHFNSPDHKAAYDKCRELNTEKAKVSNDTKQPVQNELKIDIPKTQNDKKDETGRILQIAPNEKKKETIVSQKAEDEKKNEIPRILQQAQKNNKITVENGMIFIPEKSTFSDAKTNKLSPLDMNAYYCKALGATDYITDEEDGTKLCILCGWNLKTQWDATQHIRADHHKAILRMHKDRLEKMSKDINPIISPDRSEATIEHFTYTTKESLKDKSKIVDSITEFQKNRVKVDLITESAFCNMCLKNVDFDYDTIQNHIAGHKKKGKETPKKEIFNERAKPDGTTLFSKPVHINRNEERSTRSSSASSRASKDDDIDEFARQNNFLLNRFKNDALCTVCDIHISLSLESMRQHITGAKHKSNLSKPQKKIKKDLVKVQLDQYVHTLTQIQTIVACDTILNDSVCIPRNSFLMLKNIAGRMFCLVCHIFFNDEVEVDEHKGLSIHRRNLEESLVVSSLEEEFVRAFKHEDDFHCGHCNVILSGTDELDTHLVTMEHNECKRANQWRLQMHLPEIKKDREARALSHVLSVLSM